MDAKNVSEGDKVLHVTEEHPNGILQVVFEVDETGQRVKIGGDLASARWVAVADVKEVMLD